jgi:hypothetical protein
MRTLSTSCGHPDSRRIKNVLFEQMTSVGVGGGGEGGAMRLGISRGSKCQGPNVLVGHFVAHGGVIAMHLIVALHDLNQKLQFDNDEFGGQS